MDPAPPTANQMPTTMQEPIGSIPQVKEKKGKGKILLFVFLGIIVIAAIGLGIYLYLQYSQNQNDTSDDTGTQTEYSEKKTITIAIHWTDEHQLNGIYDGDTLVSKGLNQYLEDYEALNPQIDLEIQQIEYSKYADELQVMHEIDNPPDIYQTYSTWGVNFVENDMLDTPPADVLEDIEKNYVTTAGVTIEDQIWGIPTEINDYALLYNKKIFEEAGIVDENGDAAPPESWDELVDAAVKTTKKDSDGNITRYGFAFLKDLDWGVVDSFLSVLFTNGGDYLSEDNTQCLVSSDEGVETLNAMLELFNRGATDENSNIWDFGKEDTVAMVITAPWVEGTLRESYGDDFDTDIGVAPVPPMETNASLQYNWFIGVMDKSQNKDEAWDFLRWFVLEEQEDTGTTRYGDLLTETIGAIPSRKSDIDGHADNLASSFKKTFVEELDNSIAEPNVLEASELKNILMTEIQSTWTGDKTAKQALDSACEDIEKILLNYYE